MGVCDINRRAIKRATVTAVAIVAMALGGLGIAAPAASAGALGLRPADGSQPYDYSTLSTVAYDAEQGLSLLATSGVGVDGRGSFAFDGVSELTLRDGESTLTATLLRLGQLVREDGLSVEMLFEIDGAEGAPFLGEPGTLLGVVVDLPIAAVEGGGGPLAIESSTRAFALAVPEPSLVALALLGAGVAGAAGRRRKIRGRAEA